MDKSIPWRIEWDESLSVGIPEIDIDHQRFLRLINELNEAIITRMEREKIRTCMRSILEDAYCHFAHEEALFKEWGYPEAAEHSRKHEQMILVMNKIMGRFEHNCTEYELIEAGLNVKAALINHLLTEDMKYRDYFQQLSIEQVSEKNA